MDSRQAPCGGNPLNMALWNPTLERVILGRTRPYTDTSPHVIYASTGFTHSLSRTEKPRFAESLCQRPGMWAPWELPLRKCTHTLEVHHRIALGDTVAFPMYGGGLEDEALLSGMYSNLYGLPTRGANGAITPVRRCCFPGPSRQLHRPRRLRSFTFNLGN